MVCETRLEWDFFVISLGLTLSRVVSGAPQTLAGTRVWCSIHGMHLGTPVGCEDKEFALFLQVLGPSAHFRQNYHKLQKF